MKTVGELLKEARLKKGFSLQEIAGLIKIRVEFLMALEGNDFAKIPQATTTKGFLRNYAEFLDLKAENVLAIFRRDFLENEKGQIIPRGMIVPLNKYTFSWNPKMTLIASVIIVVAFFVYYLANQYLSLISAPKIEIFSPLASEIIRQKQIEFVGKTDKDASLYINNEIVNLKENGEFSKKTGLINGENEVVFEAISRTGQKTRLVRKQKAEIP
jgi:cytoskeletal protein RodZ